MPSEERLVLADSNLDLYAVRKGALANTLFGNHDEAQREAIRHLLLSPESTDTHLRLSLVHSLGSAPAAEVMTQIADLRGFAQTVREREKEVCFLLAELALLRNLFLRGAVDGKSLYVVLLNTEGSAVAAHATQAFQSLLNLDNTAEVF